MINLIKKYINIKKIGNKLFSICIFHQENTESLLINKKFFFCFGCKKSGNLLYLLNILKNKNIKKLENKNKVNNNLNNSIKKININYKIINKKLFNNFLKKRKIKDYIIKIFKLNSYINLNSIKYKNRLIIPILDKKNNLLAYSARTIKNEKPKYLNSSNNNYYIRKKNFYGYWINIKYIKKSKYVILVEGYFDLMMLYQYKIKNVLSVMGNDLNKYRINKLRKISKNIIICFDGDKSGINSINKIIILYLNYNISIKYILIPNYLDVDLFLRKYNKKNFIKKLYNSKSIDFVFVYLFLLNVKNYFKIFKFLIKKNYKIIKYFYLNLKYRIKLLIYIFYNNYYKKLKNRINSIKKNFFLFLEYKLLSFFLLFPNLFYCIRKDNLRLLFKYFLNKNIFLQLIKKINFIKKKNFINLYYYFILKENYLILFYINKNIKLYFLIKYNLNNYIKKKKNNKLKFLVFFIKNTIKYIINLNEKKIY